MQQVVEESLLKTLVFLRLDDHDTSHLGVVVWNTTARAFTRGEGELKREGPGARGHENKLCVKIASRASVERGIASPSPLQPSCRCASGVGLGIRGTAGT